MTQAAVLGANASIMSTPVGTAPGYMARAWVNFNGTGTVAIRASGNVSSITDNGTGDYTVNFTVAMSDANYVIVGSTVGSDNGATFVDSRGAAPTTAGARFGTWSTIAGSTADRNFVNIAIFR